MELASSRIELQELFNFITGVVMVAPIIVDFRNLLLVWHVSASVSAITQSVPAHPGFNYSREVAYFSLPLSSESPCWLLSVTLCSLLYGNFPTDFQFESLSWKFLFDSSSRLTSSPWSPLRDQLQFSLLVISQKTEASENLLTWYRDSLL